MKSNQKTSAKSIPSGSQKPGIPSSVTSTGLAETISKKLLEIKRISGDGEMTELNMALFRHLK